MITTLLLMTVLATPADNFARAFSATNRIGSPDGQRLVHASGFVAETGERRAEDAARSFLTTHGAAFGISAEQRLVLKSAPADGQAGAVRFERIINGMPVFGGDVVVGVDALRRVFVANSGDAGSMPTGRHSIGRAAATAVARASIAGTDDGKAVAVEVGWRRFGSLLRAVYRIDLVSEKPAGEWRVFVDGDTGTVLFREDLRYYASAPATVFEVSPVETASSPCPMSGTLYTACATPVSVLLPNLVTGNDLVGTQTSVYNCRGADAPESAADVPGVCASVASSGNGFNFQVDSTYQSTVDEFAAAMAYYHLDKHATFMKGLDPALPSGGGRAIAGSLPALVNSYQAGSPFNNAFYSGASDAMVFGQGGFDFAYDASIAYHEFTHGAVSAWGGFNLDIDQLGGLDEPGAVNEGTADAMAVSETGSSQIGRFLASLFAPGATFMRDVSDPNASRTCQGDGTRVNRFGTATPMFINGLDGEVHDDGEIWSGFYWEVFQGLRAAGLKGCNGGCDAGPALQYKTLQLAAGTSPTLRSYAQTMTAAASALFPAQSGAAAYVQCVASRRRFDSCNRTVPVYAGEYKAQFVRLRFSPFQVVLTANGAGAQFSLCSLNGTPTIVYARKDQPVEITAVSSATGPATVTADASAQFSQVCSGGSAVYNLPSTGTWYLLLDSPSALVGAAPGSDIYKVGASPTGIASRTATAPSTCTPPFLSVTPASVAIPPKASIALGASGGSGIGYTWSVGTSTSGSSVTSAGVFTAGSNGGVVDVVQVKDSLGNIATRTVSITAGVSIAPSTSSVAPNGTVTFKATGGSGGGFTWSLATNGSGGSINASTGGYTAGATISVTDVVQVTDSLGNVARATVTVASPKSGGCGYSTGGDAISALLVLGVALLRRRRSLVARRL